jgi:hypothetical protein
MAGGLALMVEPAIAGGWAQLAGTDDGRPMSDHLDEPLIDWIAEIAAGSPSPAASAWQQRVAQAYLDSNGSRTWDEVAKLSSQGRPRVSTQLKRRRARDALAEAWRIKRVTETSDWAASGELANEIAFFKAHVLPEWLRRGGPPQGASVLRTALYEALTVGGDPPESQRRIDALMRGLT